VEHPERAVVLPSLQDLSEESFDPSALSGQGRVKEDQARLVRQHWGGCHFRTSARLEGRGLGPG
jgi:hypothetical protein